MKKINKKEPTRGRSSSSGKKRKKDTRRSKNTAKRRTPAQKGRKDQYIEGSLRISPSGFGFLSQKDGGKDLKVENGFLHTGLHGDTVVASVSSYWKGEPDTVHVEKVLVRAKESFVGTLKNSDDHSFYAVHLQDPRMYTDILVPQNSVAAEDLGKKVLVSIDQWDDPSKEPRGHILQVIGLPNLHETEMQAVLLDKGIVSNFSEKVEKEAALIKHNETAIMNEALKNRLDYRDVPTFTIDPEDAKDFDDALSYIERENGDIEIGVHIADVSHYVHPGTALDREAINRGTSVYMVDRTIPMLPEVLSNDLCSLRPNEDKLAFSVIFTFDNRSVTEGAGYRIKKYTVEKTVIRSDKRFSYEEAQRVLDAGNGPFFRELSSLNILAKKIAAQNKKEGALSFSQEEVKFVLDENKKPIDVRIKTLGETNELIESFMLLANKTVTEYIHTIVQDEDERLFLYRVHDKPDKERILELISLLRGLGYVLHMKDGSISSDELNKILEATADTAESSLVHMATIRSMAKAIYSIQNIGHFGLAFENYTHFTSPIRRYPDVIVHRLIMTYKNGKRIPSKEWNNYRVLADRLSEKEKTAMEAERGSIKYKQVEYMQDKKDIVMQGVITGVVKWGLYVEEITSKTDGLVRIQDLPNDRYILEKEKMMFVGEKTKKQYRLGDTVAIKIKNVDLENRTIEYMLI